MSSTPVTAREIRRWFAGRGFTPLLDGTSITTGNSNLRLLVTLLAVLAVMVVSPLLLPSDSSTSDGWLAALTAAIVIAYWPISNLVRRRPVLALPKVGWAERVAFVLIPALAAFAAPGSAQDELGLGLNAWINRAVVSASWIIGQLILLGLITVTINSSIWGVGAWLRRQVVSSFMVAGSALGRALPLLLGVVGFFFFTGELWQSLGRLDGWGYWMALALFVLLSWVFLASRSHLDLDALARFESVDDLRRELLDTPLADVIGLDAPVDCPLTREQESSLRLVAVISRLTLATVIAAAVFAFFTVFGVLVANTEVVKAWASGPPKVLLAWETIHHGYALTVEHTRVAGFLGVFSGFYFAIVSATDPVLKEGLRDTAEDTIREACAARLAALARFPRPVAH